MGNVWRPCSYFVCTMHSCRLFIYVNLPLIGSAYPLGSCEWKNPPVRQQPGLWILGKVYRQLIIWLNYFFTWQTTYVRWSWLVADSLTSGLDILHRWFYLLRESLFILFSLRPFFLACFFFFFSRVKGRPTVECLGRVIQPVGNWRGLFSIFYCFVVAYTQMRHTSAGVFKLFYVKDSQIWLPLLKKIKKKVKTKSSSRLILELIILYYISRGYINTLETCCL